MKRGRESPASWSFSRSFYVFNIEKWLIGRPLKSGAEGEGGLLGKMQALAMPLVTRFLLSPTVQSKLSWSWWPFQRVSHLVVYSDWDCGPDSPSQFNDFLSPGHSCLPSRGGGLHGDYMENLSPKAGLIAGGSLLVDCMLTVAVSVSSGADAITSAIPSLHPYNLHISILLVLILMLMNSWGYANQLHPWWFRSICSLSVPLPWSAMVWSKSWRVTWPITQLLMWVKTISGG